MITIEQLDAKYSDETAIVLINNIINDRKIDDLIDVHNVWIQNTDSTDDDLDADNEEMKTDSVPAFDVFVLDLRQYNVYRTHKLAISLFINAVNDDAKRMAYAILAIETSLYVCDHVPEKEARRIKASYGSIKNVINQKHWPIKYYAT